MLAEEVMMPVQIGIKARRFAFRGHFPDESGPGQNAQIVIYRGAGSTRIVAIHREENLVCGGVNRTARQKLQNGVALGGWPQRGAAKRLIEFC